MGFYKKNKGGTSMRRCRSYIKSINAADSYLPLLKSLGGKSAGVSEKENIKVSAESQNKKMASEPLYIKKNASQNLKEKSAEERDNLVSFVSSFDFHKSEEGIVIARFVPSGKKRSLELPSSVLGAQISAIGPGAFAGFADLVKVVIPEGVTSIGAGAFAGCSNLGSITFPRTLKSIGVGAFKGCVSLTNICFSGSLEELGESAFSKCTALKRVSFAGTNLRVIPKLCFFECESLNDIEWPGSLNTIGEEAFALCTSLEVLRLPKSVQALSCSSFRNCNGLTSIILPDSLTSLAELSFAECLSLADIKLPETILEIGNSAFSGCKKLRRIRLGSKLQKISASAFRDCTSLEDIVFPIGLFYLGRCAFSGCTNLKKVDLSRCRISSIDAEAFSGCQKISDLLLPLCLQKIGAFCFKNCLNLSSVKIPSRVVSLGDHCFEGCHKLSNVELAAAVSIPEGCFSGCSQLENISFNENMPEIGSCAFAECHALSNIVLPDNIQVIRDRAFLNCTNLSEVNCGSHLRRLGSEVFKGCINLRRIDLPASLNAFGSEGNIFSNTADDLVIYGALNSSAEEYARRCRIKFYDPLLHEMKDEGNEEAENSAVTAEDNSEELTPEEAEVEEIENSSSRLVRRQVFGLKVTPLSYKSITSKGDWIVIRHKAFEKKADARSNVPIAVHLGGINHIGNRAFCNRNVVFLDCSDSLVSIGKAAFWGCSLMQKVRWSKRLSFIDKSAFWGCHSLKSLELPDSLQFIDNWAFLGCSGIENLRLPSYLVSLGDYVFAYCTSLHSVVIPSGTRSLGTGVFFGCNSLRRIVIPPSVKQFGPELCKFSPIFGRGCHLDDSADNSEYNCDIPEQITIVCQKDSAAHEYALQFGLNFELACFEDEISVKEPNPGGSYMLGGLGVVEGTSKCAQALNSRFSFAPFKYSVRLVTPELKKRAEFKDSLLNENELAGMSSAEAFSILQGAYEILDQAEFSKIWQKHIWHSGSSLKKVLNSSRLFSSIKDILPKEFELASKEDNANKVSQPSSQDVLNAACDILDLMERLGYFQLPDLAPGRYRLQGKVFSLNEVKEVVSAAPDFEPTEAECNVIDAAKADSASCCTADQDNLIQSHIFSSAPADNKNGELMQSSTSEILKGAVETESVKVFVPNAASYYDSMPSHLLGNIQRLSQNKEKLADFFSDLTAGLLPFSSSSLMPRSRRELEKRYFNAFHLHIAEAADGVKASDNVSASSLDEEKPVTIQSVADVENSLVKDSAKMSIEAAEATDGIVTSDNLSISSVDKEEPDTTLPVASIESSLVKDSLSENTKATETANKCIQAETVCSNETEPKTESKIHSDPTQVSSSVSCGDSNVSVSFEGVVLARVPNFSLVKAEVPNTLEGRPVESLGDNFIKGSSTVEEIYLGANLKVIGKDAFRSCSRLRLISMPEGLQIIKDGAMRSCERLTEVVLPDSIKEIGCRVFCACSGLRSLKLSSSLISIGEAAFADCRSLVSLELPQSLKRLGSKAFFGCRNLESIFIPESLEILEERLFDVSQKLTIYAPPHSAAAVYAADHGITYREAYAYNWHALAEAQKQINEASVPSSVVVSPPAEVKSSKAEAKAISKNKAKYLKRLSSRIRSKRR
ncbi:MAG: leucine-rich repeat domain-containing protein [Candidatus Bruticola sp.]